MELDEKGTSTVKFRRWKKISSRKKMEENELTVGKRMVQAKRYKKPVDTVHIGTNASH
jgi:hypothetical protein